VDRHQQTNSTCLSITTAFVPSRHREACANPIVRWRPMPLQLAPGSFYGHRCGQILAGAFTITESAYGTGTHLPRHSHARDHFCFVVQGSYRERLAGRESDRLPMSVTFQPAGVEHEERHAGEGRHLLVEVDVANLLPDPDEARLLRDVVDLSGTAAMRLAGRMVTELRQGEADASQVCEELGLALVQSAIATRQAASVGRLEPTWLRPVDEILRSSGTGRLGLQDLAEAIGVHKSHLARTFLQHRGCTIGEELRRLRVARAAAMLVESTESLVGIAAACGFADQAHFTRVFRRCAGITPARFRAAAR
jgi:AraC-like DNA-binding protein